MIYNFSLQPIIQITTKGGLDRTFAGKDFANEFCSVAVTSTPYCLCKKHLKKKEEGNEELKTEEEGGGETERRKMSINEEDKNGGGRRRRKKRKVK